jgi:hypothetical protein
LLALLEEDFQVFLVGEALEGLIDEVVELVVFGVEEDLFLAQGDQGHAHVEQVVLVVLVDEEIEDLVDQRDIHVSALERGYLAKTVRISWVTTIDSGIS